MTELPVANPDNELPALNVPPEQISLAFQISVFFVIVIPLLGVASVPWMVWGWGFRLTDLSLLISFYVLTALGITVGYHRLFVHRSFETTLVVKFVLAILGSMAVQGPLLKWVAMHRRHHQHADKPGDPHSPHVHDKGVLGIFRGIWHAHIGWLFANNPPDLDHYIQDLNQSHALRAASFLFPLWIVLGLILPAAIGGLIAGTWKAALTGFIWGGLVRVFLVHHVTWSINSACHLWGRRPFRSNDESRNNAVFGVLAMGEGWHNTHHAFPTSARHGLDWWQIDISYWVIWTLARLGLAWDVKLPSPQAQSERRRLGPT